MYLPFIYYLPDNYSPFPKNYWQLFPTPNNYLSIIYHPKKLFGNYFPVPNNFLTIINYVNMYAIIVSRTLDRKIRENPAKIKNSALDVVGSRSRRSLKYVNTIHTNKHPNARE